MPLVKKKYQLRQVQYLIKFLLEQHTNTLIQEHVLSLLRQLMRQEQQVLTHLWTSPSTMQNLQRMQVYRRSLLDSLSGGTTQDTF